MLADVAVAAQHLHAEIGGLEAEIGDSALTIGVIRRDEILGLLRARPDRRMAALRVERCAPTQTASARQPSVLARMVSSMRRTSGWTMIGSAGLSGILGAGQRAALQALAGIGDGALIGDLAEAEALHADREALGVHHREHRAHALVRLADQPARGARRSS